MSDDYLLVAAMLGIGGLIGMAGVPILARRYRTGVLRVFGQEVTSASGIRYQALVASIVFVTAAALLAAILGAGIWLAMSGPK